MKTHLSGLSILILVVLLLIAEYFVSCDKQPKTPEERQAPQIIYKEKLVPYEVKVFVMPTKGQISAMKDSLLAEVLKEQKRQMIGVKKHTETKLFGKRKDYLDIQYFNHDSLRIEQETHEILPDDNFTIDYKGKLAISEKDRKKGIRKAKWQAVGRTAGNVLKIGIPLAIGYAVGSAM